MSDPDFIIVLPITMDKKLYPASEKPKKYGFLLVLTALTLVMWLFTRFFRWGRVTKSVLSKKVEKLQHEIETLEILLEQAKLDLRRVRLEQKTLQTEEDRQKTNETTHPLSADIPQTENDHTARPE